ncbi:MAG: DUF5676 family membrane protein [Patescibacteria group bacterium]
MTNTNHLLKVTSAWVSIVYVVCYAFVAMYPAGRIAFMRYSMHADVSFTSNYFGAGYFISGLIIWNAVALLAVWLFITLYKGIK